MGSLLDDVKLEVYIVNLTVATSKEAP